MIEQSNGYQSLRTAILADTKSGWSEDERMKKLTFAVERAKHYEEVTGIPAGEILSRWEELRDYWYMNYYQDAKQPMLTGKTVRVFDSTKNLLEAIGDKGFRCPLCNGVSKNPYACDSGVLVHRLRDDREKAPCDWKVYGLFGDLGKGVWVFVKDEMQGERMFKPVAWEELTELVAAAKE